MGSNSTVLTKCCCTWLPLIEIQLDEAWSSLDARTFSSCISETEKWTFLFTAGTVENGGNAISSRSQGRRLFCFPVLGSVAKSMIFLVFSSVFIRNYGLVIKKGADRIVGMNSPDCISKNLGHVLRTFSFLRRFVQRNRIGYQHQIDR
jgi:hypothetical protein